MSFAALTQTSLASRFVSWAGLSGKTYVFSVYTPCDMSGVLRCDPAGGHA